MSLMFNYISLIFCACFFCRYSNLDFGWKKSIDSKSFISCPSTCTEDNDDYSDSDEDHCKPAASSAAPDHTAQEDLGASSSEPKEGTVSKESCNAPDIKLEMCAHRAQLSEEHRSVCECSRNLSNGHDVCLNCQLAINLSTHITTSVRSSEPQDGHECNPDEKSDFHDGRVKKPTSERWLACGTPTSTEAPSKVSSSSSAPETATLPGDCVKALGPNPGLILQALTLSNASDGFNLERLEMLGDSFLKHAITTYLFCTYPDAHEGRLSYMRSKKVGCILVMTNWTPRCFIDLILISLWSKGYLGSQISGSGKRQLLDYLNTRRKLLMETST